MSTLKITSASRLFLPFVLGLVLVVILGLPSALAAATTEVTVGGTGVYGGDILSFSPNTFTIHVGDSVHFTNAGGMHNVDFTSIGVKCANGCSDTGGTTTDPLDAAWSFTRTFNTAGTFPFMCDMHGGAPYNMKGTITVQPAASQPGTLAFSLASYSVSEAAALATITVTRTGGDDGAVSVSYSATAGTATAGVDFQATSGTLNWAAADDASKTFQVHILNDGTSDGSETVNLTLSGVTGGATLGLASATLTITDAAASAGTLGLSQATYSVSENAGSATITVTRTGGTAGAVSAHYSTTAGSGAVGKDFQPASGTLNWAAGDGSSKTFQVTVLEDSTSQTTETVNLHLSSPTGGAVLGRSAALLNIQNAPAGAVPAAPTGLTAAASSTSEILLAWQDKANNETSYHVEQQIPPASFTEIQSLGANSTSAPVSGLPPATFYNYRVRAQNGSGFSPYSNVAPATTDTTPAPCVADSTTLCVDDLASDKRFKVQVTFHTTQGSGFAGSGTAIPLSTLGVNRGGLFWFFSADNPEMLIKVLNNCSTSGKYWVFYAAGTNVGLTTTVTDTVTGHMATYLNPDRTSAAPVQDTAALPCS